MLAYEATGHIYFVIRLSKAVYIILSILLLLITRTNVVGHVCNEGMIEEQCIHDRMVPCLMLELQYVRDVKQYELLARFRGHGNHYPDSYS
ncbi:unnamed protein product [Cuscuta campestris]|uniref:Uncharacterized protein n=1 Tax=Cuscuta campestris TaxID=132261 RepID=A0A484M0Z9_9ASTE|nr:unnamed protein product [Cuscuta campestris]